jgi:dihydroxyacid dehydratase/phosphogluconate dehydratase
MAGHIAPEAVHGGPIAAVHDGDTITIDVEARRIDVELDDEEIARLDAAGQPQLGFPRSFLESSGVRELIYGKTFAKLKL